MASVPGYSVQQAHREIAFLRGQLAHLTAQADILKATIETLLTLPDGSTWDSSGLTLSGPVKYGTIPVYAATASSNLSVSGTMADVTGASVSVTVDGSNSTVVILISVDAQTNASSNAAITAVANWNGSDQSGQALIQTGSAVAQRATVYQSYLVTGVSAGTYTAKIRGSGTSGGVIRGTHTKITVMVWEAD